MEERHRNDMLASEHPIHSATPHTMQVSEFVRATPGHYTHPCHPIHTSGRRVCARHHREAAAGGEAARGEGGAGGLGDGGRG